jgi:hypothetical protein
VQFAINLAHLPRIVPSAMSAFLEISWGNPAREMHAKAGSIYLLAEILNSIEQGIFECRAANSHQIIQN